MSNIKNIIKKIIPPSSSKFVQYINSVNQNIDKKNNEIKKLNRKILEQQNEIIKLQKNNISLYKNFEMQQIVNQSAINRLYESLNHNDKSESHIPKLIVSLTTFPARINTVNITIESLLKQTIKADMLILWLGDNEFPNKEKDLPDNLLNLLEKGLTINWCKDIKSYKKLIPTINKYPEDIIVTADDDIVYHEEWLKKLYDAYLLNPDYIQCHRITKFIKEKNRWKTVVGGFDFYKEPSYLNKITGGAGTLYPPKCFYHDINNEELFLLLAPTSDDIWFWLMAVLNDVKINVVKENIAKLNYVEGTQEGPCLYKINDKGENLFWVHFNNVINAYPILKQKLEEEYKKMNYK